MTGSWSDGEDAAKLLADDGISLRLYRHIANRGTKVIEELCMDHEVHCEGAKSPLTFNLVSVKPNSSDMQ